MLLRSKLCYLMPCLRPFLHFSTLKTQNPSPKPHFMVDYLMNSCGFSFDQANKALKHLTHLKSPSNPDSALRFLKQCGFSDAHIKEIVSKNPRFLCSDVEKTLKPKFSAFLEMGFSQSDLIRLVLSNSHAFRYRDLRSKVEVLRSLSMTNESILKALSRPQSFLAASLAKTIMPNISLLRECGILDHQMAKAISNFTWFVSWNPSSMEAAIRKADELGVSRGSRMFCYVIQYIVSTSREAFDAKFKLFESLGWSKTEIVAAMGKSPTIFKLSEKSIRDKMDFFVKEVGCKLSYVISRPVLFSYSLERRLVPRLMVLKMIKREELLKGEHDFLSVIVLNEEEFLEKCVLLHKEKAPGIHEAYVAACSHNVSI